MQQPDRNNKAFEWLDPNKKTQQNCIDMLGILLRELKENDNVQDKDVALWVLILGRSKFAQFLLTYDIGHDGKVIEHEQFAPHHKPLHEYLRDFISKAKLLLPKSLDSAQRLSHYIETRTGFTNRAVLALHSYFTTTEWQPWSVAETIMSLNVSPHKVHSTSIYRGEKCLEYLALPYWTLELILGNRDQIPLFHDLGPRSTMTNEQSLIEINFESSFRFVLSTLGSQVGWPHPLEHEHGQPTSSFIHLMNALVSHKRSIRLDNTAHIAESPITNLMTLNFTTEIGMHGKQAPIRLIQAFIKASVQVFINCYQIRQRLNLPQSITRIIEQFFAMLKKKWPRVQFFKNQGQISSNQTEPLLNLSNLELCQLFLSSHAIVTITNLFSHVEQELIRSHGFVQPNSPGKTLLYRFSNWIAYALDRVHFFSTRLRHEYGMTGSSMVTGEKLLNFYIPQGPYFPNEAGSMTNRQARRYA
ncbi:hypothetical protein OIO90_004300 [Microbotryomycetes sp. JL221]|nr:hypothetical protein OIO90_004300 [Microbotryomycetes sp. JL221]